MRNKAIHRDIPLTVQFRHMKPSKSIQSTAAQQVDRLLPFSVPGSHCEVVIDRMHPWKKGGMYDVSVQVTFPGRRRYQAHRSTSGSSHEVVHVTVHEAFDEIRRQIMKQRSRRKRSRMRGSARACAPSLVRAFPRLA